MSEISSSQRVLLLRELNGELKWFSNGDVKIWIRVFWKMCTNGKYVGEIKNREPSGSGTLTLSNGGKYVGEWKEGKEHGQGTFSFHDGRKYVGEWEKGKVHGQGEFIWSNGDKYEGEWKKGQKHGHGTVTFSGGGKWIGEFRRVKPWNISGYDKDGNIIGKFVNGVEQ